MSDAGSYAGSAAGDRKEMLDESVREAKRDLQEAMRAYQKATAELKLGLKRLLTQPRGLSLVHRMPIKGAPRNCALGIDVGATLRRW